MPVGFLSDLVPYAEIVGRTLAVYVFLLAAFRIAGKRELGVMAPFDLVVMLVIANAVQNAMVGSDTTLRGGLTAAATLLVANWLIVRLEQRSRWLEVSLSGSPTLLVSDGRTIIDNLRREHVTDADIAHALREHGIDAIQEVKLAVLEVDGTISVVPMSSQVHRSTHRVNRLKSARRGL